MGSIIRSRASCNSKGHIADPDQFRETKLVCLLYERSARDIELTLKTDERSGRSKSDEDEGRSGPEIILRVKKKNLGDKYGQIRGSRKQIWKSGIFYP